MEYLKHVLVCDFLFWAIFAGVTVWDAAFFNRTTLYTYKLIVKWL